jgi:hypothetical protein
MRCTLFWYFALTVKVTDSGYGFLFAGVATDNPFRGSVHPSCTLTRHVFANRRW